MPIYINGVRMLPMSFMIPDEPDYDQEYEEYLEVEAEAIASIEAMEASDDEE